ncbi:MAG: type II toxin-antitoxin system HicB family antitoxin [Gemmataceae bacterium]|nr:type II toxin-antitoxin system HicB family antitoxin [Planctomycetia bacterium]MBX3400061.1 type II toxin-antitoxin system HicB family antitoxin [Gemmataceae bacterium]
MKRKKTTYTVSDGKLVLTFDPQPEGGYVVTSPLDPELITEAETIQEGFENAADALDLLKAVRKIVPTSRRRRSGRVAVP